MADEVSWRKPVLIAALVFVVVIAAAAYLIIFKSGDNLPFDYAGFDGAKK